MPTSKEPEIHRLDIPCEVDATDLTRRLRVPRGNERLRDNVLALSERAVAVARPQALYRQASAAVIDRDTVTVDGVRLRSRALRKNLTDGMTVYPFIATVGPEIDGLALPRNAMMLRFYLDTIKTVVLVTAIESLVGHIRETYSLGGTAHMNPGEIDDFGLSEQAPLFSLFRGRERDIGVKLKASGIMKPVKSRSGIIFPNETGFTTCFLCTQRYCPGRRARYSEEKVVEYLGEAR